MRTVRHDRSADNTRIWRILEILQHAHGHCSHTAVLSIGDLIGLTPKTIRQYLDFLGEVRAIEPVLGLGRASRIVNPGEAPPMPTTADAHKRSVEAALWTAMRAMSTFSAQELAVAATTETTTVTTHDAVLYVNVLTRAGYIAPVSRSIHRLLPSGNTGPRAPVVHRRGNKRSLFDLNTMQTVNVNRSSNDAMGRAA